MLISVYLPTRDRHAQLRCAVESVLNQTHREFELIVVDDASSDETPDYLHALASGDARVRVLRNASPRGAPACRNAAVALARGDWVTGLDDDDEFLPERLALMTSYAQLLAAAGWPFCGVFAQDLVQVDDRSYVPSKKRGPVHFEELFASNLIGNQILVRRSDYLDAGGFDERLPAWQDLDFLLRLTRRFGPAELLDVPLYVFDDRPRDDRISRQRKARLLDSYRLIVAKYAEQPLKLRQLLYLQAFGRCYGHALGARDAVRFFRMGFDAAATLQLARILARRGTAGAAGAEARGAR